MYQWFERIEQEKEWEQTPRETWGRHVYVRWRNQELLNKGTQLGVKLDSVCCSLDFCSYM